MPLRWMEISAQVLLCCPTTHYGISYKSQQKRQGGAIGQCRALTWSRHPSSNLCRPKILKMRAVCKTLSGEEIDLLFHVYIEN